ncbi:RNA-binding protein [bacterium]|nr:RNA-binding protein [bacterium]MBU1638300.1 RNA-binding protein [bacterium]MBU1919200.1 RNA-binding protein [bacterium]
MSKKLYVGNLPFTSTEEEIKELFAAHGEVISVALVNDRETGRPRGFGFVEMDDDAAGAAIAALDGKEFGGRSLRVNEARERERRPRSE